MVLECQFCKQYIAAFIAQCIPETFIFLSRGQTRTEVRKKALDVLSLVLSINTHVYEVSRYPTILSSLFFVLMIEPVVGT